MPSLTLVNASVPEVPVTPATFRSVTVPGFVIVTAGALVVPLATFDRAPNTGLTFGVPRNATSRNL